MYVKVDTIRIIARGDKLRRVSFDLSYWQRDSPIVPNFVRLYICILRQRGVTESVKNVFVARVAKVFPIEIARDTCCCKMAN